MSDYSNLEQKLGTLIELVSVLVIQSMRNYDLMGALLSSQGVDITELYDMHQNGGTLTPAPVLIPEESSG